MLPAQLAPHISCPPPSWTQPSLWPAQHLDTRLGSRASSGPRLSGTATAEVRALPQGAAHAPQELPGPGSKALQSIPRPSPPLPSPALAHPHPFSVHTGATSWGASHSADQLSPRTVRGAPRHAHLHLHLHRRPVLPAPPSLPPHSHLSLCGSLQATRAGLHRPQHQTQWCLGPIGTPRAMGLDRWTDGWTDVGKCQGAQSHPTPDGPGPGSASPSMVRLTR